MARLPRYQRLGVRSRQISDIDYAGLREQAALGQTISAEFARMGEFVFERGAEMAEQEGLKAVKEQGALPILERINQAGGPTTIAEKSAYNAANQIAVTEIQNEAELEITRIIEQAEQNITPFTQVQKQLNSVADGFSASLSNIDPVAAGKLRSNLQTTAEKSSLTYSTWYTGKQAALAAERRTVVGQNDAAMIIKNIPTMHGQDADTSVLDMQIDIKAREYVENQGWSQKNADAWVKSTKADARNQWVNFKIQNSNEEQLEKFYNNVITGKTIITGDYTKDLQYARAAKTNLGVKQRAKEDEAKAIKADIDEKRRILLNGGAVADANWFNQVETRIETNGQYSTQNKQNLTDLRFLSTNLENWKKMSAFELSKMVNQINESGIPGYEEAGLDTTFETEVANLAEKILQSAKNVEEAKLRHENKINSDIAKIEIDAKRSIAAVFAEEEKQERESWSEKVLELGRQFETQIKIVNEGGKLNSIKISNILIGLGKIPSEYRDDLYEEILDDLKILNEAQNIATKIPGMSQQELAATIQTLNKNIEDQEDAGNNDYLSALETKNYLDAYLEARFTAVSDDMIKYAAQNGVELQDGTELEFVPINFSAIEGETPDQMAERIQAQFRSRKEFSQKAFAKYAQRADQPKKFFTKQEVSQLVGFLDGMAERPGIKQAPVQTQAAILSSIFEAVGTTTGREMMAEIFPQAKGYGIAGALLLNPATAQNGEMLLEGIYDIKVAGAKIQDFGAGKTEPIFNTMVTGTFKDTLSGHMQQGLRETAKYFYSQLVNEEDIIDDKYVFNSEKYTQALNMSLGAIYNGPEHLGGGIMSFRDGEVLLPPAMPPEILEGLLNKIDKSNILSILNIDDEAVISQEEIEQISGQKIVTFKSRAKTKKGEISQRRVKVDDTFQLEIVGGNPDDGYDYRLKYPNSNQYFELPGRPGEEAIINTNDLMRLR